MVVINNRALGALPICIILPIASLSAILLSLHAQRQRSNRIFLESYFLGAAWLIASALAALTAHSATVGDLGRTNIHIDLVLMRAAAQRYAHQLMTLTTIQLVRVALLLLYRRIFASDRFKVLVNCMFGLTAGYFIAMFGAFTSIYALYPTDRNTPINTKAFYLSSAAISMVLDILTLCLPAFAIRTLNMSPKKKVGLIAVFGLGVICVGASASRVYYFVELMRARTMPEQLAIIFYVNIWAVVEPFVSIVAATLPTCATMLRDGAPRRIAHQLRESVVRRKSTTLPSPQGSAAGKESRVLSEVSSVPEDFRPARW